MHPTTGRLSGAECTPMSDGSTLIVQRRDPKSVFDKHATALYPRHMKDHKEIKMLQAELASNYSLV